MECPRHYETYADDRLPDDSIDFRCDGRGIQQVRVGANKVFECFLVGIKATVAQGMVKERLALLLASTWYADDMQHRNALCERCGPPRWVRMK